MVEVAISLAIIGFALVAIIGVLPLGMNVQKDNREETLIGQDATVFMEAIRNGANNPYGTDLTNYVYQIAVTNTEYNSSSGGKMSTIGNLYDFTPPFALTNNARIIGLLSTPEFMANNGAPIDNLATFTGNYYSNHIVAYVHSISGPAVEKPPQTNDIVRNDSFGYKMIVENLPNAVPSDALNLYAANLTANLHELRLTFLWPSLPSGNVGYGRQTFRTMVAGQMVQTNDNQQMLYFFQPQIFTNAP